MGLHSGDEPWSFAPSMRIGIILPGGVHPSGTRDVIPAIISLIKRLAARHEVTVILLGQAARPHRFTLFGADVFDLGSFRRHLAGFHVAGSVALSTVLLGRARADVVHAFWAGHAGIAAGLAGRTLRRPVILSVSGGEFVRHDSIGYGGLRSFKDRIFGARSLALADILTSGSRDSIARIPTAREVRWLPLGADVDLFRAPVARARARVWRMLTIGSINRVKDPETMLEAMRIVLATRRDFVLDWVGQDTRRGEIQRRAFAMGLGEHVRFHGFVPQEELAAMCRNADLYVHASRHESQCVAVLEATAAGLPIVGTAVGLVRELAPKAAVAVPVGDPAALAKSALELLDSDVARLALAEEGRRFSLDHGADWTACALEDLYEEARQACFHPTRSASVSPAR